MTSSGSSLPTRDCRQVPESEAPVSAAEGVNGNITGHVGSRSNAVTHGLTARTLIPALLQPGRVDALVAMLRQEHPPRTLVEELLHREIARHAAMLEVAEAAEWAVLRQGAQGISVFGTGNQAQDDDLALAAALTTDPVDRVTRYRRAHEKALHQAIQKLREQQHSRHKQLPAKATVVERFATEDACKSHLRARFGAPDWKCPNCHAPRGHWIATRELWQCATCDKQVSLRHGTVMHGSPLSLVIWFAAIRYVAGDTGITATALQRLVGIHREGTAQSMLRRIRQAIVADDPESLLAGLSAYPLVARGEDCVKRW